MVYAKFGRQADQAHGYRFILVTEWDSMADLYAWLDGRPIGEAIAFTERVDWLTSHRVQHFEALDRELEEPAPDTG
jgi:heme-degrading monooxygenase HmoA